MARMKSYSRIITNDFDAEDQPLVESLGGTINESFNSLYSALSNRLTFEENFLCTVREVEVTLGANGVPLNRTSFVLSNDLPVKGTIVLSTTNRTSPTVFPTSAPFVSFTQNGNLLFIDHVTGLQANNRYTIRVLALN